MSIFKKIKNTVDKKVKNFKERERKTMEAWRNDVESGRGKYYDSARTVRKRNNIK